MKSKIHNFPNGKSNNSCKSKLLLLTALLLAGIFAQAQIFLYNAADPGDNYGDGTQNMIGQRHYFWDVDSSKWDWSDTFNMHYNQQNLLVLQNLLKVDTSANGPWKIAKVTTKEYDANNRLSVQVDTGHITITSGYRYEFTYNTNGQVIMLYQHAWNQSSANWKNYLRDQTTYTGFDSVNVLLSEIYNISNVWQNVRRAIHAYNAANKDTAVTYEDWNVGGSQWKGSGRYIYTYDTNGKMTSNLYQEFNDTTLTYKDNRKYNYTYDANNRLDGYVESKWNSGTNGWDNVWKYSYSFNSQGLMENMLVEKWSTTSLQWEFWNFFTYTYDANNRLQQELYQNWVTNVWQNGSRRTYTRNSNGYLTRLLVEVWNSNTLSFRNNGASDYWYETKHTNGIQEQPQVKLNVFPNPTSGTIVFVNADKNLPYAVYDMQGRLVSQGQLQTGTNGIILNEVNGIYILKAGNASVQIVKQ